MNSGTWPPSASTGPLSSASSDGVDADAVRFVATANGDDAWTEEELVVLLTLCFASPSVALRVFVTRMKLVIFAIVAVAVVSSRGANGMWKLF